MNDQPKLNYCPPCDEFVEESEVNQSGQHTCESTVIVGDLRQIFREMALDAIPHSLIATPAVGAGDARRYKIAAALWPQVERLMREVEARREGR